MHLFSFGTLATGNFRKVDGNLPAPVAAPVPRTAEAARRSSALGSSHAPGKLPPAEASPAVPSQGEMPAPHLLLA